MKNAEISFIIKIGEADESFIDVEAVSKTTANAIITARSMNEAKELMEQAELIATDKMSSYVEPIKKQERAEEHYRIAPVTQEEALRRIEHYKQTTAGKRFYKEIENGMLFMENNGHGLEAIQGGYLALETYSDSPYTTILHTYDLAFRRGYKVGKREAKKR